MRLSTFVAAPSRLAVVLIATAALGSEALQAAEVSLVSGLYQKEESDFDGEDAGGSSTISAGARYGDALDQHMHWFGQAQLTMRSYDAPSGGKAPSDSTSLSLGGGVRYYFGALSERIYPLVSGFGEFRNDKDKEVGSNGSFVENEDNGLYYGGTAGLRLTLDTSFFIDFETVLFRSALFATESSERTNCVTDETTDETTCTKGGETETSRMELFADTAGSFNETIISFGMKL